MPKIREIIDQNKQYSPFDSGNNFSIRVNSNGIYVESYSENEAMVFNNYFDFLNTIHQIVLKEPDKFKILIVPAQEIPQEVPNPPTEAQTQDQTKTNSTKKLQD